MIDALVYAFQVAVVFVTTVAVTVGVLWFLSLPWRYTFGNWEVTSYNEKDCLMGSMFVNAMIATFLLLVVVMWSFISVLG